MNSDFKEDKANITDEMVDISSGKPKAEKNGYRHNGNKSYYSKSDSENGDNAKKPKNKKAKLAIIISAAVVVVAGLAITGVCLFQNGVIDSAAKEFTFSEGTVVSGVSLSGKTMEQAQKLLESKKDSFIKPVAISVDADGEVTSLTEKDFKYTYNIDAVLSTVKNDETNPTAQKTSETKTYEITALYTQDSLDKAVDKIKKKTNKDAVNAEVSKFTPYAKNRFEYAQEKSGSKLDSEDLTNQVKSALDSGTSESRIIANVEKVDAKISIDDVKSNIKKLSSYQTVSYNTANGTSNMKTALEACSGSVIEPGATWSFNKCTGDSNLESNGYKSAHVISDGQIIDGIGGGICQASSTIYNAAIRANMNVEERTNHKWASSYVPTGLDATIDYPRLDLKLSNPTDYQMFFECRLVDSTLHVTIWGYKSSSYDKIKTHNELTSRGGSTYTVKAWRVYYKKGKEVDRESMGSSTYDDDNGYIFIDADSDTNDKTDNYQTENKKSESSSSQSSSSQSSSSSSSSKTSSSSSSHSSSSQAETQKPTQKPTQAPKPTHSPETKPASSSSESSKGE